MLRICFFLSFEGSNSTSILFIPPNHPEVKLSLRIKECSNLWFVELLQFFKNFDRSKLLTLIVSLDMVRPHMYICVPTAEFFLSCTFFLSHFFLDFLFLDYM